MTAGDVLITLWHHKERSWPTYLQNHSSLKTLEASGRVQVEVRALPEQNGHLSFARLPESLRRLLYFAKPDVVVTLDDFMTPSRPVFAVDVTEHVMARDHWMQRFPNLVGCAQEGIPGAFIVPGDMPERDKFAGRKDPFFFFAYDRVVEIHQTPIFIAEWPSSDGRTLDTDSMFPELPPHDSDSIRRVIEFFDQALDWALKGQPLDQLMQSRLFTDLRHELRRVGFEKIPRVSDFERLAVNLPNNRPLTAVEFAEWVEDRGLAIPDDLPERVLRRDAYVVYSPIVSPQADSRAKLVERIKLHGGDPYGQQPIVFDYLFCRLGPTTYERDRNLVVDLGVLKFEDFASYVTSTWDKSPLKENRMTRVRGKVPIYGLHLNEPLAQVLKGFVRFSAFAADIIVFEDGMLFF